MCLPAAIACSTFCSRDPGRAGVEVDGVFFVRETAGEVGAPAGKTMRGCNGFELFFVPAHENRVRHEDAAIVEREAALGANGEDRSDEMLIEPHASSDAVHDDSGLALPHSRS